MATAVPLPENKDLDQEIADLLDALPPLNVFRMLANVPGSFFPFMELAGSVLSRHQLDARTREIAILRAAKAMPCPYIWTQHVIVALGVGISESEINVIEKESPVAGLSGDENLVCLCADEITKGVRLSGTALAALMDRFGARIASEIILCVSYFNMLGRFIESTRVPIEDKPAI